MNKKGMTMRTKMPNKKMPLKKMPLLRKAAPIMRRGAKPIKPKVMKRMA